MPAVFLKGKQVTEITLYFETDGLPVTRDCKDPSIPNVLAVVLNGKTYYVKQEDGYNVPEHITAINGITDKDISTGHNIRDIAEIIRSYTKGNVTVYSFYTGFQQTMLGSILYKDASVNNPYVPLWHDSPYAPYEDYSERYLSPRLTWIDLFFANSKFINNKSLREFVATLEGNQREQITQVKKILKQHKNLKCANI
jgi:hypothetical protein